MFPKTYTGRAWLVAVLLLLLGLWLSARNFLGDRYWFARSGSLVTSLAIWTAYWRLSKIDSYAGVYEFARAIGDARIHRRYPEDPEKRRSLEERNEARIASIRDEHLAKVEGSFVYLEIGLLLLGTLVWGFGDLIKLFWE